MGWSDEALMGNLRQGDMQAFDPLYTRHRQALFNFILRIVQDAALAEDVFQETYMRVLENADRFKPRGKFSTWLYTIAHNLCMDELRRQSTSIPAEQMAEPPTRSPHDHLLKRDDEAAAHQLLAALPPHLRAVVVVRVLHDYSQEETAKIELLETVPEGLLQPIQRTAILLPAVIGGRDLSSQDRDLIPKHLVTSPRPVAMTRVKDGLVAIAVAPPRLMPGTQSLGQYWEKKERLRLWMNIFTLVTLIGLILFWLSIPAWMTLDAQKKRERATIWGLFGFLGNVIALVVYLLVRENKDNSL